MSHVLVWSNILAWSLQAGLVVGVGALAQETLKLRMPRARLLYWQVLLVACLSLPWIRGWRQEVVAGAIQVSSVITAAAAVTAPVRRVIPFPQIALWVLEAGIALRLLWLVAGIVRLSAYRRRGTAIVSPAGSGVTLLLSDDVASPVTFGWRDPVVLLPANFEELPETMQDAILCHELLHVERRDWLFTIAEEVVRAVLWFHPAIWWVIGEIQLAREQTVDQAVIETTRARGPYVDALLLMAGASLESGSLEGASGQLELAPAPMFLRRRHLKRRLMEVVKEVRMATISKTRLVLAMSAAVAMVAGVCWLATGAFPLIAAPQVVNDAAGVAVNMNGSQLMHRTPVAYPANALARGVEGTVVVQVKLDANAEVSDATVLSGPDELRRAVLQSVLSWHFDRSAALTTRTVNIDFVKPTAPAPGGLVTPPQVVTPLVPGRQFAVGGRGGSGGMIAPSPISAKLDHIEVAGLSDTARAQLLASLPVQEGAEWNGQTLTAVREAASKFDSHLTVGVMRSANGAVTLRIGLANSDAAPLGAIGGGVTLTYQTTATRTDGPVFTVGNGTTAPAVLSKVDPQYSEEARDAKYSGSVVVSVVINTEGKADDIKVLKSLGMGLDEKAIEAVQQWRFRPGMNQGVPVNVRAQIEVNFRL